MLGAVPRAFSCLAFPSNSCRAPERELLSCFEACGSYPWALSPSEGGPVHTAWSRHGRKALVLVMGTLSCVQVGPGGPRWVQSVEPHHQMDGTLPTPVKSMGQSESATQKECVLSGYHALVSHTCAHTLLPAEGSDSGLSVSRPPPHSHEGNVGGCCSCVSSVPRHQY